MTVPNFPVQPNQTIAIELSFVGFAIYSVLLSDWNGTAWKDRPQAIVANGSSHSTDPKDYDLDKLAPGGSLLVTVPMSLTSPSGTDSVKATLTFRQGTAVVGSVDTPTMNPAPDEQASTVVRVSLSA